ncbi:MAG: OmpA family protein [Bryobacteraceae bacterium]|nr:OmpA family protein [Bryobacteraceae bacterium]
MSAGNNDQTIIIVKKKINAAGHHGGAWKVAYADFVTAMMAFFMVMWLMGSSEDVQKAVAGYFNDPTGTGKKTGSSMAGSGETLMISKDNMKDLKEQLEQAMKDMPEFETVKDQVKMTITGEGLRIELMETEKGMFFESGSPSPTGNGKDVLANLAKELGQMDNNVVIEGHTDARPLKRTDYSNWELSGDRANAARRFMQDSGLRADQVKQVRGFADQNLAKPDDPGAPQNRRISIIVQYGNRKPAPEEEEEEEEGAAHGKKGGHGEGGHGAKKDSHAGKSDDHGAKPAGHAAKKDDHGKGEAHGGKPAEKATEKSKEKPSEKPAPVKAEAKPEAKAEAKKPAETKTADTKSAETKKKKKKKKAEPAAAPAGGHD